ncbi:MAG TPA: thioredoxin domain-containing protein, partial [Pyrinomonadaceae bacterium]|nr:thioredoxin domain-containing protein [Pyrinomonadaceae bacterium]
RVLISVAEAYRDRAQDIAETGTSLLNELRRLSAGGAADHPIEQELLEAAYTGIVRSYDSTNGGFGGAPKFPPAMTLEFLLRTYVRTPNKDTLEMISHTCRKMADGGIYDQLGGGFHRYATDARWLVPHFEKMLYDNALLSRLYLHHFQVTESALSRTTVAGVLDYVLREMTDVGGGFYSTQDADSEGHEGKFFVWDIDEIRSALGETAAALFCDYYNVTEQGNFEGKNILNVKRTIDDVAVANRVSVNELAESLANSRRILFELREQRVKPDRDEKIITAWNGLMLASFAEAGVILKRPDYTEAARRNAEFVLQNLSRDGFLLRTYKDGIAKFNAYLEDYAFFIEGLVTLYETTGELRWLNEALTLTDRMIEEFWDEENGGFFFTGKSHESLIVRSKDYFDNATPSGNSVAAGVLLRLAVLTGKDNYRNVAIAVFREAADTARRFPSGFGYLLSDIDFLLSTPKEVAIIGRDAADIEPLLSEVWRRYLPNKVVAPAFVEEAATSQLPLLQDRPMLEDRATAYVCEHYTCKQPVTDLQSLSFLLP